MATFALQLAQFQADTEQRALLTIKRIVLEMFKRVMQRTPVDTGNARANWDIGINAIPDGFEATVETGELGDISQRAFAKGLTEFESFKIGDTAYIVNNVEYIGFLEDRRSDQAPNGMVKITVREFQTIVDELAVGI